MSSKKQKFKLYDAVQKLWVSTCVTVTIGALGFIGYNLYNYFVYVKPIKKEMEEQFKEQLLKEGRMLREAATQRAAELK